MTVLCVNSSVTYADIAAADAAEGGTDYGVPTRYEQAGTSTTALTFVDVDYPSSFIYIATAGEETTGVITVGAQMTAQITVGAIANSVIENLRVNVVNSSSATGHHNQSLVASGTGQDLFVFGNLAGTDDNCIAHDCSEGWRGGSTNNNHISTNCTSVDNTGFGFLRPRAVNTVALNTASATYLQEGASSSNYWADDGNGSNAITEVTKTDIFEDYAGGDYRIKPASSVGVAGVGAFINASSGTAVTTDPIDQAQTIDQVTLTENSVLTIGGLSQAQTIDQITLQQGGTLSLNNLDQIQTIDQVNLTQAHIVSVNDLSQLQTVDQTSLTQANILTLNDADQIQTIDQVTLSTAGTVAINDASQAQTLEQLVLAIAGTVAINNLSQSQLLEQLNLTQAHVVSVDNLSQAQLLQSINFNGVVVGYLQGALTIVSAYNGQIKLTNPLTGEIRIL